LVKTVDDQAKAGEDYQELVQTINFKNGEAFQVVEVLINDDENWEPDEDFWVQLYSVDKEVELRGQDTKTRVTIIDDDKPG
jgi:solute carrier family 8 (sodium/calcium exchanger)